MPNVLLFFWWFWYWHPVGNVYDFYKFCIAHILLFVFILHPIKQPTHNLYVHTVNTKHLCFGFGHFIFYAYPFHSFSVLYLSFYKYISFLFKKQVFFAIVDKLNQNNLVCAKCSFILLVAMSK